MNRLVVTLDIGNVDYRNETLPVLMQYAKFCDADFMAWTQKSKIVKDNDYCCWSKIDILDWFSKQHRYDELLYLDLDVVPNLKSPENVFNHLNECDVSWVRELWCNGETHEDYTTFVREFNEEAHGAYCNAGIFLIRKEGAQKLNLDGPYPNLPIFDQDYLNYRINMNPNISVHLLEYRFNCVLVCEAPDDAVFVHCAFKDKWLIPSTVKRFTI